MASFYAAHGVDVIWMPYDSGVCASRNAAVARVVDDWFVLVDDDFIFLPETRFDGAIAILRARPHISVVGGRLVDVYENGGSIYKSERYWENILYYDPAGRSLVALPIHHLAPVVGHVGQHAFYLCDAVMNFAVFRRSMFSDGICWDADFLSNGEHEDFYLTLKVRGRHRVAYLPSMVCEHHHPSMPGYRRKRERSAGWRLFLQKWGLDQYLDFSLGLRVITDVDQTVSVNDLTRERFFVNDHLRWNRTVPAEPGTFTVAGTELRRARVYDEHGAALGDSTHSLASFLLSDNWGMVPIGMQSFTGAPAARHRLSGGGLFADRAPVFMLYRPVVSLTDDLVVYLNVQTRYSGTVPRFAVSIRSEARYDVYLTPIQGYELEFEAGQWTACMLPMPPAVGLMTLEVFERAADGRSWRFAVAGEMLFTGSGAAAIDVPWVYGWSAAATDAAMGTADIWSRMMSVAASEEPRWETACSRFPLENPGDVTLHLLQLTAPNESRPESIAFSQFPYRQGSNRLLCALPPNAEQPLTMVLPIDRCREAVAVHVAVATCNGAVESVRLHVMATEAAPGSVSGAGASSVALSPCRRIGKPAPADAA
jgi:hypothetical protein